MIFEGSIGTIKMTGYVAIASLLVYLNIPQESIAILSALMIFDWITGVGKQIRIDKRNLTSYRMGLGVMKKVSLFFLLCSGGLVLKVFTIEPSIYIQTVISVLVMSEFYSIIQNVYAIRTGVILPEYDAISISLKKLSSFIEQTIERLTTFPKKK